MTIEGRTIRAVDHIDISSVFRGDEKILVQLLLDKDPVLLLEQLWENAKAIGVGHPSFWRLLSSSPVISRMGKGVYGLVGAKTVPGEIEEILAQQSKRQKSLQDHGWTKSGNVWTAYRLSESALNSGVVSIPAAKRTFLDGEFELYDQNAKRVGKLKLNSGMCWGIGPYLRRVGLERGDFVRIEFDLKLRTASIESGDEGILDRCNEFE